MEESTPINQLKGNPKPDLDNVSYSDLLGKLQSKPSPEHINVINNNNNNVPQFDKVTEEIMSTPINQLIPEHAYETKLPYMPYQENNYYNPVAIQEPVRIPETQNQVITHTVDDTKSSDYQNEMIVLLVVYVILHTDYFQNMIRTKLPSMFNIETNNINIFGTIINAVILIVVWNISKKIVVKYIKEFN